MDEIEYTSSQPPLVRQGHHPTTTVVRRNIRSGSTPFLPKRCLYNSGMNNNFPSTNQLINQSHFPRGI